MLKPWKTLSSKLAFDHRWFKVQQDTVELPNGQIMDDYFMWKNMEVVMVVPVTEDGKFVMVRQYKHAAREIMIEFPAGYAEDNEQFEIGARRELLEETGYQVTHLEHLGDLINNPTKELGRLHLYLARGVKKVAEQQLDSSESIEVHLYSLAEVEQLIANHQIFTSGTIAALSLAKKKLAASFI